jgi:hypothetical protein
MGVQVALLSKLKKAAPGRLNPPAFFATRQNQQREL